MTPGYLLALWTMPLWAPWVGFGLLLRAQRPPPPPAPREQQTGPPAGAGR